MNTVCDFACVSFYQLFSKSHSIQWHKHIIWVDCLLCFVHLFTCLHSCVTCCLVTCLGFRALLRFHCISCDRPVDMIPGQWVPVLTFCCVRQLWTLPFSEHLSQNTGYFRGPLFNFTTFICYDRWYFNNQDLSVNVLLTNSKAIFVCDRNSLNIQTWQDVPFLGHTCTNYFFFVCIFTCLRVAWFVNCLLLCLLVLQ